MLGRRRFVVPAPAGRVAGRPVPWNVPRLTCQSGLPPSGSNSATAILRS